MTFFSRGHQHRKKIYRVDFFAKASSAALTNYIIRHNSKKGNMTSLFWVLGQNTISLVPVTGKDYNMILTMYKSLILLMYVDSSMKNKFIHTCSASGKQHTT